MVVILGHCDIKTLLRVAQASKSFYNVVHREILTRVLGQDSKKEENKEQSLRILGCWKDLWNDIKTIGPERQYLYVKLKAIFAQLFWGYWEEKGRENIFPYSQPGNKEILKDPVKGDCGEGVLGYWLETGCMDFGEKENAAAFENYLSKTNGYTGVILAKGQPTEEFLPFFCEVQAAISDKGKGVLFNLVYSKVGADCIDPNSATTDPLKWKNKVANHLVGIKGTWGDGVGYDLKSNGRFGKLPKPTFPS